MLAPKVLVVDDEVLIQMLLETDLTDAGFSVGIASTLDEAVTQLEDKETCCQALVTDINLADGVSGWDVARRARELNPTLPVVYMTGDSAHEWPVQGVPNSILVAKPFASVQVVNAVAQLLTDAAVASPPPTG